MAIKTHLTITISSFFLLHLLSLLTASSTDEQYGATNTTNHHHHKEPAIVIEGMVYCQNCKYYGTWNLNEAEPLGSAQVSVLCKNYKRRVAFYRAFKTDESGYFYAELYGYKINHLLDHPLHACKVKLVSSPQKGCNLLSNINLGMYGAPLRYEDKIIHGDNYRAVVYAAGPLAFRPNYCPPQETKY